MKIQSTMLRRAFLTSCRHPTNTLGQAGQQNILSVQAPTNTFLTKYMKTFSSNCIKDGINVSEDFSPQGVQGEVCSTDNTSIYSLNQHWMSASIKKLFMQGEDCTQFKIWLENCYKLGDQDCIDQYQSFRAGRKTLSQIFAEQDAAIRQVVLLYRGRRGASGPGLTTRGLHTSTRHRSSSQKADNKESVSSDTSKETTEPQEQELTPRQKLKRAVKEYGGIVVVFHVGISLMSLGFFYVLVSSGVDVAAFLAWAGVGEAALKAAAGAGTFVMAYAVHKVFAPARIATTLTATPLIVRSLRARGILKPPKP